MSVDISFIYILYIKSLHEIRENSVLTKLFAVGLFRHFFLNKIWVWEKNGPKPIIQINDDPRDTRKSWVILLEAIDAKNSMVRHCCILRQKYTLPS